MRFKLTKLLLGTTLGFTPLFSTLSSQSALAADVYNWYQGQNPNYMMNLSQGVCFLTSVQGKFEGGGERVRVYQNNNQWVLDGTSDQEGVGGTATCVPWAQLVSVGVVSGPYKWSQGQPRTRMDNFGNSFCFLSEVSGKFRGGGEHIEITLDPYSRDWLLGGDSQQQGVNAAAYCVGTGYNYSRLTAEFTLAQGSITTVNLDLGGPYSSCFLTGIKGKFRGDGERVSVYSNLGEWYLQVTSDQFDVSGSTRCYK